MKYIISIIRIKFTNFVNPVTSGRCNGKAAKQGFANQSELLFAEIETDYLSQAFLLSVGILSIYILHLILNKRFR